MRAAAGTGTVGSRMWHGLTRCLAGACRCAAQQGAGLRYRPIARRAQGAAPATQGTAYHWVLTGAAAASRAAAAAQAGAASAAEVGTDGGEAGASADGGASCSNTKRAIGAQV